MTDEVAVSVLVSVTSDAGDLEELYAALLTELEKLDLEYEVIFLLLAAPEAALRQARVLAQENPERVRVIEFTATIDKAAMLTAGIERARADLVFTLPGRFEIDLQAIGSLHAAIEAGHTKRCLIDKIDALIANNEQRTFLPPEESKTQ